MGIKLKLEFCAEDAKATIGFVGAELDERLQGVEEVRAVAKGFHDYLPDK